MSDTFLWVFPPWHFQYLPFAFPFNSPFASVLFLLCSSFLFVSFSPPYLTNTFFPSSALLVCLALCSPPFPFCFHSQSHSSPLMHYCSPCILLPWSSLFIFLVSFCKVSCVPSLLIPALQFLPVPVLLSGTDGKLQPVSLSSCWFPSPWGSSSDQLFLHLLFTSSLSGVSFMSLGPDEVSLLLRDWTKQDKNGENFLLCFSARAVSNMWHLTALKVS